MSADQAYLDLLQLRVSESTADGEYPALAWTRLYIDVLADAGVLSAGCAVHIEVPAFDALVSGGELSDGTLDLYAFLLRADFRQALTFDEVSFAFTRLQNFYEKARRRLIPVQDGESSESADLIDTCCNKDIERVRFFVLTNGVVSDLLEARFAPDENKKIWGIDQLAELEGDEHRSVEVNFRNLGFRNLPFIKAPLTGAEYEAYLLIFPGALLAKIYSHFGERILQQNVRSFLQVKGGINKGIQNTIRSSPANFFAYNNGISATASRLDIERNSSGSEEITAIHGLQIVNGGQTTASIHHAHALCAAEVDHVYVQAKITIVTDPVKEREFVPLISQFANSQNKVNITDLSANNRFNIAVEKLSRSVSVPSHPEQSPSFWYYERARGQYLNARGPKSSAADKAAFEKRNPKERLFTKIDLAKYENTWEQLPHIVSRGGEKNFRYFDAQVVNNLPETKLNEEWYREAIAKAILFRTCEKLASERSDWKGYRANVVAYTVSWIAKHVEEFVDFDAIWQTQNVNPILRKVMVKVMTEVRRSLVETPGIGNITEWCKKEQAWDVVKQLVVNLDDLIAEAAALAGDAGFSVITDHKRQDISEISKDDSVALVVSTISEMGPITTMALYRALEDKFGILRRGPLIANKLKRMAILSVRSGKVLTRKEFSDSSFEEQVVFLDGQSDRARERGNRDIAAIAPSEIVASTIELFKIQSSDLTRQLVKDVLEKVYGIQRETAAIKRLIDAALAYAGALVDSE